MTDNIVSLAQHRRAKGVSPYSTASISAEAGLNGAMYYRVRLIGTQEMAGDDVSGRSAGVCATWHDALLFTRSLQNHYGPLTVLDGAVLAHGELRLLDPPAAFVLVSPVFQRSDLFDVAACPHPDLGGWFATYRNNLSLAEAEAAARALSGRLALPVLGMDNEGDAA